MKPDLLGAKIVVIGGGTGSFTVLSGLKNYASNITALVNMADDGGSTGILRDELGALPPGDVRQCLVALSRNASVRDLFNYRFTDGSLKGHAFGNLFLSALEQMSGNFAEGVELASKVLNITGRVEPITLTNVRLCAEGADGNLVKNEFEIAHTRLKNKPKVWLEPKAEVNPQAITAIEQADMVVVAPGNLYGSLAPALVVPGVGAALAKTKAKCVYICNLVTKPGATDDFKVADFANEIERLAGTKFLDDVIYNTLKPPQKLMQRYAHDKEYLVAIDEARLSKQAYRTHGQRLMALDVWQGAQASDPIASVRSYIRHDPDAVARAIMRLYFD